MTKSKERLILVTGATGHQGGAVLRHLRASGFPTRAMTRDMASPKAKSLMGHQTEVVRGEFDDHDSLVRALDGAFGAYSVQDWTGGKNAEVRQGIAMANAAARAEIDHFVYSSVGAADQNTGIPHFDSKFEIEEHIRSSGLAYTIVRPVFFMSNFEGMREGIEAGKLMMPLDPETRFQMVAPDDIGAFVVLAFEHGGTWHNRAIELAGDELTMKEIAAAFSRVSGRDVEYVQVPWDQFEERMGHEMSVMFRWFQDVGYNVDISARRQEYPKLSTLARWLENHWPKKPS